jgi:hypothetical protein
LLSLHAGGLQTVGDARTVASLSKLVVFTAPRPARPSVTVCEAQLSRIVLGKIIARFMRRAVLPSASLRHRLVCMRPGSATRLMLAISDMGVRADCLSAPLRAPSIQGLNLAVGRQPNMGTN